MKIIIAILLAIMLALAVSLVAASGFQLRGQLIFAGFHNGTEVWQLGNSFRIIVSEPVLSKYLFELEGKKVSITIVEDK